MSILPIFVFSLVFAGSAEAAWWSFGRSNNTKDQIKSENSEFNQGKRDNRGTGMQRESGKGQQGESGKGQQGESGKGQQRDSFPSSLSSEAIACMKTAVEARETSIISATSAFHSSIATALDARKTALVDAWSLSSATEIKTALKSAGSSFESSQKLPQKLLNPPIKRL